MKNINIILLSIFLSFLTFTPFAVSAKDFLVAIDTGHGLEQLGAISARGVGEYFFNQRIANGVHARIGSQKCGIKSFLINNSSGNMPLLERAKLAGKEKADLFISIHHDSVQPHLLSFWDVNGEKHHYCDKYKGYSLFYSEKNTDPYHSILFAIFVSSEMLNNKFTPTLHHAEYMKGENKALVDAEKGIYKYNELVVLKNTSMPAVLVECGIIVNRDEEIELDKKECQEKIVTSIVKAINRYYKFINNKSDKITNK